MGNPLWVNDSCGLEKSAIKGPMSATSPYPGQHQHLQWVRGKRKWEKCRYV